MKSIKTGDQIETQEDDLATSTLQKTYKYFLILKVVAILIFIPVILLQMYYSIMYFSYVKSEVNKYHYYFVTQSMVKSTYITDVYAEVPYTAPLTYEETYLPSSCKHDYSFSRLIVLGEVKNTEIIEITDSINMQDPDFPEQNLDPNSRN